MPLGETAPKARVLFVLGSPPEGAQVSIDADKIAEVRRLKDQELGPSEIAKRLEIGPRVCLSSASLALVSRLEEVSNKQLIGVFLKSQAVV
jgi:hypothetical protein